MESLDDFLSQGKPVMRPISRYVEHPEFRSLYARIGPRYINLGKFRDTSKMVCPVITIASIEAEDPGKGAFGRLLTHLNEKFPGWGIYVECVQEQDRLGAYLLRNGFSPLFYSPGDYFKE
jgi:hypothetical protein